LSETKTAFEKLQIMVSYHEICFMCSL